MSNSPTSLRLPTVMPVFQRRNLAIATFAAVCFWGALSADIDAQTQTVTVVGPDGVPQVITAPAGMPPGAMPVPGGPTPPGAPNQPKGGQATPAEGPGENGGQSPEPKVIRRGDQQPGQADPEELKATVGADGTVAFQFRNQAWVELIQWLADIAEQPLDWQELPADRVNLRSPGRYTVEQTKDLFNRHLLARGYTLLEMPGGITVAKTEGINAAMVPRVNLAELDGLMPHSFVRTSLDLGWLSSEKMAEELKPMISSNGRLTALTMTNRIEAMDAAINLRQVAALLEQERNQSSREALAPEFRLRHIPAETAKQMLEEFLGVEKKTDSPMSAQQMAMMQQMQRQNGGQPQPEPKKSEISIVANTRQNSVLIRAPIDRIAIATEFINRIDVPSHSMMSLTDIETRLQVFRLSSIDPKKLIEIINEMNVLEPATQIRADDTNKALIVSGSAPDRFIIDRLIKRLDGSGRAFEVLQLRRLEANEVAESIAFLMGKDKEEEGNANSRRSYYYGYGFGNEQEDKKEDDEFRVAANSRFRQVMLWANESEMEQVRNLLIKLGELPPPGGSQRTVRKIDASSSPETYQYLMQLKQQWSQISDAPLELPSQDEFIDPISSPEMSPADDEDPPVDDANNGGLETTQRPAASNGLRLTATPFGTADDAQAPVDAGGDENRPVAEASAVGTLGDQPNAAIQSVRDFDRLFGGAERIGPDQRQQPDNDPADPAADRSPIRIQLDEEGNLVLSGSNTKALDQLENLMLQVAPPKRPYHVFKIQHQTAGYIQLNLEEYFENKEEENESDRFFRYWFDMDQSADEGPKGLEKQNELRFVYDPDTNTIVVSGATSSQLRTISELIELWDVAEPVNKRKMRYTKLVNVEFGRAATIAETVKEAYRDLLSSNDKTFVQGGRGGQGGGAPGGEEKASGRQRQGSGLVDGDNGRDGGDVDFSFKGKLSMGVDEIGNTLIVSAEGEPLLELVVEMIHKLDQAAKPAGDVQILSLSGNTSQASIESVLKAFGGNAPGERTTPSAAPTAGKPPATAREPG